MSTNEVPEKETGKKKNNSALFIVIGLMAAIGLMTMFLFVIPGVEKSKAENNLALCASNLNDIASILDKYAANHDGLYPESLESLKTEGYLKKIPNCPEAKLDTYSFGYKPADDRKTYILFCIGSHHKKAGAKTDYPRFDSEKGVVDKLK